MGALRVGDTVFSDLGLPVRVVAAHAVDPAPVSYRVQFDDGSYLDAGAEHLWLTYTASELAALTRRSDVWRARRRERRVSRVTGRRSALFTATIQTRNRQHPPPSVAAPIGRVRSTVEIATSLRLASGRANHAIPVAAPLELPEADLPLDPYLLGCWLGDGTTKAGSITTTDPEILAAFAAEFQLGAQNRYTHGILGLATRLRAVGVFGHKHVPPQYLRASIKQRLNLLQGLMDTDGTACRSGSVEFASTLRGLAEAVAELACSLGHKATVREGRARLNGEDYGPNYRVKWAAPECVFRLERKARRQQLARRRTTRFRYIVACERIASQPMRCITVDSPSHLYLAGRAMIPTHNSWGLLLDAARYVRTVPGYGAVIFRRTHPEIRNQGGLWDEAYKLYLAPPLRGVPNETRLEWTFPPYGNTITFAHMQHEHDRFKWQGAQIPVIGFDELTTFTRAQFFYMLSRNRSTCGVRPYIRATTNPDADSWVAEFIAWWIDPQSGLPIGDRAGVLRWFRQSAKDETLEWADREADLIDPSDPENRPLSVTFIPATVHDNVALLDRDPEYLRKLMQLPFVERARLLGGNWKIRPAAGQVFDRGWFEIVDQVPKDIVARVRYWDKAGTPGSKSFAVGVRLAVSAAGIFYVEDVERGQWLAPERNRVMLRVAQADGPHVFQWVEQEPGSGGKESAEITQAEFAEYGIVVDIERVTGEKYDRAKPMSWHAERHNIKLVRGDWNEPWLDEHYRFPEGAHDDQVDASSGAFNKLVILYNEIKLYGFDQTDVDAEMADNLPIREVSGSFIEAELYRQ